MTAADGAKPYVVPRLVREADDFIYRFEFDRMTVVVRLAHPHVDKGDFTFHLWVQVLGTADEPLEHVHWSKFNIAVDSTRNGIVKTLTRKQPDLLDWERAVEYVATKTYLALAEGDPPEEIDPDAVPDDEELYAVEGVAPLHQVTTMYAKGGSLKSLVALTLALCVLHGVEFGPFVPLARGAVLYLDYETVRQEQARRISKLLRGLALRGGPRVHYLRGRVPLPMMREQLQRTCTRLGVQLLVVDSIAPAAGGPVEESAFANGFFDVLMALEGVTCLVVAHVTKGDRDKGAHEALPFGSVFVENRSRALWHLHNATPSNAGPHAVNKVVMTMTKANNTHKGRKLVVHYRWREDGAIEVGTGDVRRDPDLVQAHGSLTARVRQALQQGGPQTYDELVAATGVPANSLRATVNRMGDQLVQLDPDERGLKRWALRAHHDPDAVPLSAVLQDLDNPSPAPNGKAAGAWYEAPAVRWQDEPPALGDDDAPYDEQEYAL